MTHWLILLLGSLVFGAAIVTAMAVPRFGTPLAVLSGAAGILSAVYALGTISQRYQTPAAIGTAIFFLLAGIVLGYMITASSLFQLAWRRDSAALLPEPTSDGAAIVLLGYAEPERYSPRAIAYRQMLLQESADIQLPLTAVPFVFLTEKARYSAAGGRSPAAEAARMLAERVLASGRVESGVDAVDTAWCHTPGTLSAAVREKARAGAARIAVVILGASGSAPLEAALALLPGVTNDSARLRVSVSESIWTDRRLPHRLAERVLEEADGAERATLGVVLVGAGMPPAWERRYADTSAEETYFNERVRMLLVEAGVGEQNVRSAWLEWQLPDVTEAVRHLAALGCQRIVVAPGTIALPTLETTLDLRRAIALARAPHPVRVTTLQTWAEEDLLATCVRDAALNSLQKMRS